MVRDRYRWLLAMVAFVAAAAVAVGCGADADGASAEGAAGGGGDGTLTLVGYTTPREVYEQVIPDFQATPAGEGITSSSPTAPPATRAARSRPASTPMSWLSRSPLT
jgi:ABC-type phosphate transport system substrate-binding protein